MPTGIDKRRTRREAARMTDQQERCGFGFVPAYDRATVQKCMRNADHGGPHEERRAIADYLDERAETNVSIIFENRKVLVAERDEARAERDALDEKLETCRRALRVLRDEYAELHDRSTALVAQHDEDERLRVAVLARMNGTPP